MKMFGVLIHIWKMLINQLAAIEWDNTIVLKQCGGRDSWWSSHFTVVLKQCGGRDSWWSSQFIAQFSSQISGPRESLQI